MYTFSTVRCYTNKKHPKTLLLKKTRDLINFYTIAMTKKTNKKTIPIQYLIPCFLFTKPCKIKNVFSSQLILKKFRIPHHCLVF